MPPQKVSYYHKSVNKKMQLSRNTDPNSDSASVPDSCYLPITMKR